VIVDGNHRACVAYHLGIDVPFDHIATRDAAQRIVNNSSEPYGAKNEVVPCQSIYYGNELLLEGSRQDIYERFMKVHIGDIRGKSVLDLGANVGANASLAWYYGAKDVTAMEASPKLVTSSLRLSTFLGSRIDLKIQDLGKRIPGSKKYDTVFCLSLHAHVKDKIMLERNILKVTEPGSILYFEGHENSRKGDYRHILDHFKKVELIDYNRDGVHSKKSTRPFFRCVR
jgi:2-polyprenyl-3-methyl-5-hydroxy-6-metoxy-1,4-benzoquinol methylase